MRSRRLVMLGTVAIAILSMVGLSQAQGLQQYFDNGTVDWAKGVVTAKGIGAPPANVINMAQARAMAKRAAVVVAQRNLLEIVKGVRIDSQTIVQNFVTQSDIIRNQVSGIVRHAQVTDVAYMSDGSVEATVAMPMTGQFAQIILPPAVQERPPVQPAPTPPATAPAPPAPQAVAPSVITGMVVDARGLGVRPAMSPKIVNEDGAEVYGSAYVGREYAVQQGMAGYAKDLTAAQNNARVSPKPLTVKGIKATGPARCDVVISNDDAEKIKSAAKNLSFLQQCKVMIVLD